MIIISHTRQYKKVDGEATQEIQKNVVFVSALAKADTFVDTKDIKKKIKTVDMRRKLLILPSCQSMKAVGS